MFVCRVQPLDKELEWTDEVRTLVESLMAWEISLRLFS